MTQPDLFDRVPLYEKFTRKGSSIVPPQREEIVRARASDPATSKSAALRVDEFANNHHRIILVALTDIGAMTVAELAQATGLDEHRIGKRTIELQRIGRIELTGAIRPGASGRPQRVWRAA